MTRLLLVLIACTALAANAADYYAAHNGQTPVSPFTSWEGAASNIQEAVNQTAAGDTVWVGPGHYKVPPSPVYATSSTNIVSIPAPITLRSSSGNPADTIIDGEGTYRLIRMTAATTETEPYIVDGFTLTNGFSEFGSGGIIVLKAQNGIRRVIVRNSVLTHNVGYPESGRSGGAIYVTWRHDWDRPDIDVTVSNCVIRNNSTNAIWMTTYSTTGNHTIVDSLFEDNVGRAIVLGGSGATGTIENCIFRGNVSSNNTYGMGLASSRHTLIRNSLFYNNKNLSTYGGGNNYYGGAAIYLSGAGTTNYIENSTIVSNFCTSGGRALSQHFNVQVSRLKNTLIYYNEDEIYGDSVSADYSLPGVDTSTFTNCLVRGTPSGSGNITKAPEFQDLAGGDCRLRPWSSGVDAGLVETWMATATDVAGNPRISDNGLVDIGAYETELAPRPIHYVAQNGQTPVAPYTNLTFAASNIQDAVNAAVVTDIEIVEVAPGRYTLPPNPTNYVGPNIVYIDKAVILRGATGNPADVILDGEGANRGILVAYDGQGKVELDGLTITNCHATTAGGGVLLMRPSTGYSTASGWTGVVKNCVLRDNTVQYGPAVGPLPEGAYGGGVHILTRNPSTFSISNCAFRGNMATNELADPAGSGGIGGGLYFTTYSTGPLHMYGTVMESNVAYRGASAYVGGGPKIFENSVIANGVLRPTGGQSFGGGIFVGGGHVTFKGCLMYGNDSGGRGGAINYEGQGSNNIFRIYNCTIVDNARGVYIRGWAEAQRYFPEMRAFNSIVYGNGSGTVGNFYLSEPPANYTNIAVNSCYVPEDTPNMVWHTESITNDPLFKDATNDDYRLRPSSPCIDAGMNLPGMETEFDIDGRARLDDQAQQVDMGCYEYSYVGTAIFIF